MNDYKYAQLAIEMAKKSFDEGDFPAGAVIVRNDEVVAQNTSAKYPQINFHAESKTIDEAINKLNSQLTDCILYCSMQPCLMCLSRAYWAGIRRIVYVVKKEKVDTKLCYESPLDHENIASSFNEKIEIVQLPELENEAMETYNKWIQINN